MSNLKVTISPGLELRIIFRIMPIAHLFQSSMEVLHVICINVGWCNISASPKPPDTIICLEVPIVEVHCGAKWISRMHDATEPTRKKGNLFFRFHALHLFSCAFGGNLQCLLRHGPIDDRQIHTSLFPNFSIGENSRTSTTSIFARPAVLVKFCATIDCGNFFRDFNLRFSKHLLHLAAHREIAIGTIFLPNKRVWKRDLR
mmetsp:Transcript_18239/g.52686  ORF Transcript_18239/g.52686 Transcript_18239/m.52686 type:complete len:201 (+) Transcript_18239:529-1131(+)